MDLHSLPQPAMDHDGLFQFFERHPDLGSGSDNRNVVESYPGSDFRVDLHPFPLFSVKSDGLGGIGDGFEFQADSFVVGFLRQEIEIL